MSFVSAQPEELTAAAGELTGIGAAMAAQNAAAAAATTGVVPAAADPLSALTAAQFVAHADRLAGCARHLGDRSAELRVSTRRHDASGGGRLSRKGNP